MSPFDSEPPGSLSLAAERAFSNGDLDAAVEKYRQALDHTPDHAPTHADLAAVLYERGEHDDAAQHFRRAIESESTPARAHYNYALFLLDERGESDRAVGRSRYDRAIPSHTTPRRRYQQVARANDSK